MKKLSPFFALVLLVFAGCVENTITNLTPSQLTRNASRQYLVECEWRSNQQSVRPVSIRPFVIIGFDAYEMRPALRMNNRWEVLVTIPANQDSVTYHFKADYEYNGFGKTGKGSVISSEYKLKIVEN